MPPFPPKNLVGCWGTCPPPHHAFQVLWSAVQPSVTDHHWDWPWTNVFPAMHHPTCRQNRHGLSWDSVEVEDWIKVKGQDFCWWITAISIQRFLLWSYFPKLKPKLLFIHSNNIFHLPVSASHLFKRSFSSSIRAIDVEVPEGENLWSFPATPTFAEKVPLTASPHSQLLPFKGSARAKQMPSIQYPMKRGDMKYVRPASQPLLCRPSKIVAIVLPSSC